MTPSLRRYLLVPALAVALVLPGACGSDDSTPSGAKALGIACSDQATCTAYNADLLCANNGKDSRIQFQCSLGCVASDSADGDSRCVDHLGSAAFCLPSAGLCVKKCSSNSDCPSGGVCTSDKQQGDFCVQSRD